MLVQFHRQVIRNLTSGRNNHTMRVLQFDDIHDALKSQFIEIEPVTYIVVGRNGLRVIIDHYRAETIIADGIQRLYATPVKLHRRTDTISSRAEHDDGFAVACIMHVILRAAIRQIEIIGLRRELSGQRVDLFHHRQNSHFLTEFTHLNDSLIHRHLFAETYSAGYLEIREAQLFSPQ